MYGSRRIIQSWLRGCARCSGTHAQDLAACQRDVTEPVRGLMLKLKGPAPCFCTMFWEFHEIQRAAPYRPLAGRGRGLIPPVVLGGLLNPACQPSRVVNASSIHTLPPASAQPMPSSQPIAGVHHQHETLEASTTPVTAQRC